MPDTSQDSVLDIKNKAPKPPGLMPKNLQAMVIFGIAILMILIMALTGRRPPKGPSATSPGPPVPLPVNADKVTDFEKRIEAKQRESAPDIERALLEQQQKQLAAQGPSSANPYGTPVTTPYPIGMYPPGAYAAATPQPSQPPPPDPIKDEQKKRQYLSLFASNVALSYRKDAAEAQPGPPQPAPAVLNATQPSRIATASAGTPNSFLAPEQFLAQAGAELAQQEQFLQQAQKAGLLPQTALPHPLAPPGADPKQAADPVQGLLPSQKQGDEPPQGQVQTGIEKEKPPNPDVPAPGAFNSAEGKKYVLFEGTIIESLLINRLDGTFAGPVSCLVTNPIYSHDRQHLLIPAGSKVLGDADKVNALGQVRLAVAFHRLITPDGYSVSLDQFKGLDQAGATALKDKVNNHYTKIFGASLAIGILGAATQGGTGTALTANGSDRIREGFGYGLGVSAERILDRFLNILPTVTIREGTRVKVYLSNDLLLPDYNSHRMSPNL